MENSAGPSRAKVSSALLLGLLPLFPAAARAQANFGVADLPADLAAPGTVVEGVLNRSPTNNNYLGWCDSPVIDKDGTVYVSISEDGGWMWKIPPGGKPQKFAKEMYQGAEFDAQGRLLAAGVTAGLRRFNADGTFASLETFAVKDMSQGTSGAMYLCDHGSLVYFRSAAGAVTKINGYHTVTGIKWIEEKKLLFIAAPGDSKIFRFTADENGALSNKMEFATLPHSDGLEVDENYNVYITNWGDGTIDVRNPDGKLLGRIPVKSPHTPNGSSNVTNLAWGGADNKSLYITGDGGLYKVQLKVAGRRLPGSVAIAPRFRDLPRRAGRLPVESVALPGLFRDGSARLSASPAWSTADGRMLRSPAAGVYLSAVPSLPADRADVP